MEGLWDSSPSSLDIPGGLHKISTSGSRDEYIRATSVTFSATIKATKERQRKNEMHPNPTFLIQESNVNKAGEENLSNLRGQILLILHKYTEDV